MLVDVWLWKTYIWLFSNFLYLFYTKDVFDTLKSNIKYSKDDLSILNLIDILNKKTIIISNNAILYQYKNILEKNWFNITKEWEKEWKKYYIFNNLIYLSENWLDTISEKLFSDIANDINLWQLLYNEYNNNKNFKEKIIWNSNKNFKMIVKKFLLWLKTNWNNFLIEIVNKKNEYINILSFFMSFLYIDIYSFYKNILFSDDNILLKVIKYKQENINDIIDIDDLDIFWLSDTFSNDWNNNKNNNKKYDNKYLKWLSKKEKDIFIELVEDDEIKIYDLNYFILQKEILEENWDWCTFFFWKNIIIDEIVFLEIWKTDEELLYRLHNKSILILTAQNTIKNATFISDLFSYENNFRTFLSFIYFINSFWILKEDIKDELRWYINSWNLSYELISSVWFELKKELDIFSWLLLKDMHSWMNNLYNSLNTLLNISYSNIFSFINEYNKKFDMLKNNDEITWAKIFNLFEPIEFFIKNVYEIWWNLKNINKEKDTYEKTKLIINIYKNLFLILKEYNEKFSKILNLWINEIKNLKNFLFKIDWEVLLYKLNKNISDKDLIEFNKIIKKQKDKLYFNNKFEIAKKVYHIDIKAWINLVDEWIFRNLNEKQKNIFVFLLIFNLFMQFFEWFLFSTNFVISLQTKIDKIINDIEEAKIIYKNWI